MQIICDANKLPEEIKAQAHEYVEKRKLRFKSFGVTRDDVEYAWLNGFSFCMEGRVDVKVKQCATCVHTNSPCVPSDYARDAEGVCTHYRNVVEENEVLKTQIDEMMCCYNCKHFTESNYCANGICRAREYACSEWELRD